MVSQHSSSVKHKPVWELKVGKTVGYSRETVEGVVHSSSRSNIVALIFQLAQRYTQEFGYLGCAKRVGH